MRLSSEAFNYLYGRYKKLLSEDMSSCTEFILYNGNVNIATTLLHEIINYKNVYSKDATAVSVGNENVACTILETSHNSSSDVCLGTTCSNQEVALETTGR